MSPIISMAISMVGCYILTQSIIQFEKKDASILAKVSLAFTITNSSITIVYNVVSQFFK